MKNNILENESLKIGKIKTLILDEADALLKEDFIEQTKKIIKRLPSDEQICGFSATFNQSFLDKTTNFMHDPHLILLLDLY